MHLGIDFDDTLVYSSGEILAVLDQLSWKFKGVGLEEQSLSGKNRKDFYHQYSFDDHVDFASYNTSFLEVRNNISNSLGYISLFCINEPMVQELRHIQRSNNVRLSIVSYRDERSLRLLCAKLLDSSLFFEGIYTVPPKVSKSSFIDNHPRLDLDFLLDDNIDNLSSLSPSVLGIHFKGANSYIINGSAGQRYCLPSLCSTIGLDSPLESG